MHIIRRGFVALLAVLALIASVVVISPASATTLATVNHDTYFDPHSTWSGEEDANGAVAMNDAGTVAVFMRPFTDETNCSGTPRAAMEIYVGIVGKTSTSWQPSVIQSSNALPGGCASFRDRHEIILNGAGTVGYALVATTSWSGNDRTTAEYVLKFTINAQGQAQLTGDHFPLGSCLSTLGCTNPFNFNLHMSAKTGDVFASVMNFSSTPYSGTVTDVGYYNATSSSWTHAALPGVQGLTSGISRDGKTTYVAGPRYLGSDTLPTSMRVHFCKGAFSPECIAGNVSWLTSGSIAEVSGSITDTGSQLAVGWSVSNSVGASLSVAVVPLNTADQGHIVGVSVRQMSRDIPVRAANQFDVFLSPSGNRVWAVMSSPDGLSQVLTTGSVSGGAVTWGGYSSTPTMESGGGWFAQMTRTGHLVIVRSNTNPELLVSDRSDAAATWFVTRLPQGRDRYTTVSSLATNATASRWAASGVVSVDVQAVAAVGVFKSIPVAKTLPTVTGLARIGAKLTAHLGTWNVSRGTSTYQWMRDGVAIDGATRSTYTTVPLDSGRKITVAVTYAKAGYFNRTATSAAKKMPGTIRYCSLSVIHTAC